jgi:hypothetical protein
MQTKRKGRTHETEVSINIWQKHFITHHQVENTFH